MMHNAVAHHPLNDAQPAPSSNLTPCPPIFPSLYIEHDIMWYGISFWSVRVSCPGCAPSKILVHLFIQQSMGSWKSPGL